MSRFALMVSKMNLMNGLCRYDYMIDPKLQAQLRERFNPDGSKLREMQLAALNILDAVDSVCRRNNIPYWLASGTLIGAMRHGGFIPWDDDLDIEILYSDKNRFIEACLKELPARYKLQCHATDGGYYLNIMKVRDVETSIDESCNLGAKRYPVNYKYSGYFIDVFTVESSHRPFLSIANIMTKALLAFRYIVKAPNWMVNIFYELNEFVFSIFRLLNKLLPSGDYSYHTYGSLFKSRRVESELIPTREYTFEGKQYFVPNNSDAYLRRIYGDYMQLPPMAQQKPHHNNDL